MALASLARMKPGARLNRPGIALLAATVLAAAVAAAGASAQDLERELGDKQAKLERVEGAQEGLAAAIERQNAEVNAVLGELAELRAAEAEIEARLARKQAQLDRTEAALRDRRDRLRALRAGLHRALVVLRERLLAIYMEGEPDVLSSILGATTWAEATAIGEYLDLVQRRDESMIARVRDLRDRTRGVVARLAAAEQRIEAARDEIAADEREVAAARATVAGRYADLQALRAERERTLAALAARAESLEGDVAQIARQIARRSAGPAPAPPPPPGAAAVLLPDGQAVAPASAPPAVRDAIQAANAIAHTPYLWGGGHGDWESSGYDCSGAVSYALHGGGFLDSPLDSTGLAFWGESGTGSWITVYANSGHVYAVIAGLRWDTSGGAGPRWHADIRTPAGFVARHPSGY